MSDHVMVIYLHSGTKPHPDNIMTYPEALILAKQLGVGTNTNNMARLMQYGRIDPSLPIKLGPAGCPIGWRVTPDGDCGFPLQPERQRTGEGAEVHAGFAGVQVRYERVGYLSNPNNAPDPPPVTEEALGHPVVETPDPVVVPVPASPDVPPQPVPVVQSAPPPTTEESAPTTRRPPFFVRPWRRIRKLFG